MVKARSSLGQAASHYGTVIFFVGVVLCISVDGRLWAHDEISADLQIIMQKEAQETAAKWEISPEIVYGNGRYAEATSDHKVIIGKQFIQNISHDIDESFRSEFLRFVVLHEMWHVKQFKVYGTHIGDLSAEWKKVYECQADVMASFTLDDAILQVAMDSPSPKQALAKLKDYRPNLFNAIAKFSVTANTKDSYLNEYERWAALRLGAALATYGKVEAQAKSPRESEVVQRISRVINWQRGVDHASWSLDMCKKITRYGKEILRNVEEFLPESSDDVSGNSDGVLHTTKLRFRNKSNRRVRVSVTALSGFYPEGASKDYALHTYHDGFSGAVEIDPGATGEIKGSYYYWSPNKTFEIFLKEWGAGEGVLMSAEYTGSPSPTRSCNDGLHVVTDQNEMKLLAGLMRIAGGARDSFSEIPKEPLVEIGGHRYYKIMMPIPGVQEGNILIKPDGSSIAHIQFYKGPDLAVARDSYHKFVQILERPCLAANVKVQNKVEKESASADFPAITAFSSGFVSLSKEKMSEKNKSNPSVFSVILYISPELPPKN